MDNRARHNHDRHDDHGPRHEMNASPSDDTTGSHRPADRNRHTGHESHAEHEQVAAGAGGEHHGERIEPEGATHAPHHEHAGHGHHEGHTVRRDETLRHEATDTAIHGRDVDHAAHGNGHHAHVDHTGHEKMFRDRFWVSLVLSIPVLLYSPMLQQWLGFTPPAFPGSRWVP